MSRLAASLLTLAACGAPGPAPGPRAAPAAPAPPPAGLPFLADDYTRAVAEARARQVPLFVEAWAPW